MTGLRPTRRGLVVLGTSGAVVLGGVSVALATTGPEVVAGTTVAGIDVGGMSRDQVRSVLSGELTSRASRPVAVTVDGDPTVIPPATAGLALDLDATVDRVASAGPLDRLRARFGGKRAVEPARRVDDAALTAAVRAVAARADRAPREGAVRFLASKPIPVLPRAGRAVTVDDAVRLVADRWLLGTTPLPLPVTVTPVRTTDADVERALAEIGTPAMSGPVTVTVTGGPRRPASIRVTPADLAVSLAVETDSDGTIVADLQGDKLLEALGTRATALQTPARDARFDVSGPSPVIVPSQTGLVVDGERLAAAVLPAALSTTARTAALALVVEEPELTTAKAKALGVKEKVGTFTTRHPCCRPRVTNIHRIADIVDGHLVKPGETFSLNGVVGERDRKRGFVEAPQILEGQFVDRVGGGVSQFATTLYNATFFAGFEDVFHKPHSYYISRYPVGREATVSFPAPDLKWRNDSPHGALVSTSYTGTSITVTIWGTKRYDEVLSIASPRTRVRSFGTEYVTRSDCTATSGAEGFDITITRVMKKGGKEVKRDSYKHRYLPEPRFVCGPKPSSSPSPGAPSAGASASPRPATSTSPSPRPAPTASPG